MKVLVIQLRQLGDILLTTPVMRALREHQHDVHVMTYGMGKLILEGNPHVTKHWIAPQKGTLDFIKFMNAIRKEVFDVAIDFMGTPRSAGITKLICAKRRIGFDTRRGFLYDDAISRIGEHEYIVKEKFRLLKPIGVSTADYRLTLPWNIKDSDVMQKFLSCEVSFAQSKRRVFLSPTHRRDDRRWTEERFAKLAMWLELEGNAKVLWGWGPGEEEQIDRIQHMAKGAGVKAPKSTFKESAGIMAGCDLFIGNSNGPSHIAVSVNTPSIQLHGPTNVVSWCPVSPQHQGLRNEVIADIRLNDVMELVQRMWPVVDVGAKSLRTLGPILNDQDVWRVRPNSIFEGL